MRDKLRPWKTTVAGRRKSGFFSSGKKQEGDFVAGDPYVHAAVAANNPPSPRRHASSDKDEENVEDGYEWEEDSDGGSDTVEPDAYSWVDPSLVGASGFRASPAGSSRNVRSPGAAASLLEQPTSPIAAPDPPTVSSSSRIDLLPVKPDS